MYEVTNVILKTLSNLFLGRKNGFKWEGEGGCSSISKLNLMCVSLLENKNVKMCAVDYDMLIS